MKSKMLVTKPGALSNLTMLFIAVGLSCVAAAEDFWVREEDGKISHRFKGASAPMVLCMLGRKVVMEVRADEAGGLIHKTRFFNVPEGRMDKSQAIFDEGSDLLPEILIDGKPFKADLPEKARFDGMLTLGYPESSGIVATRTIYPSMTRALVLDEWRLRNTGGKEVTLSVKPSRREKPEGDMVIMIWSSKGLEPTTLKVGGEIPFLEIWYQEARLIVGNRPDNVGCRPAANFQKRLPARAPACLPCN